MRSISSPLFLFFLAVFSRKPPIKTTTTWPRAGRPENVLDNLFTSVGPNAEADGLFGNFEAEELLFLKHQGQPATAAWCYISRVRPWALV